MSKFLNAIKKTAIRKDAIALSLGLLWLCVDIAILLSFPSTVIIQEYGAIANTIFIIILSILVMFKYKNRAFNSWLNKPLFK